MVLIGSPLLTNDIVQPFMHLFIIYFGRPWKPQIIESRGSKKGSHKVFYGLMGSTLKCTRGPDSKQHTKSTEVKYRSLPMSQTGPWVVHTQADLNRQCKGFEN